MAKSKGKKKGAGAKGEGPKADPMTPAVDAFAAGNYDQARSEFAARAANAEASESEKKMAQRFIAATKIEPGTLYVALSCIGLYLLVILVATLKQP